MIAGVLGSRIAYVVEHWSSEFAAHPLSVIRVDQGGLVFYGGLILAIIVYFAWCRIKRLSFLETGDIMCAVLPLGHAFGRIGCFFYGCCYGKVSDSALAVRFPVHSPAWYEQVSSGLISTSASSSLPVLPTQLFESASLLLLFVVLMFVYLRLVKTGRVAVLSSDRIWCFMRYSVSRWSSCVAIRAPKSVFFRSPRRSPSGYLPLALRFWRSLSSRPVAPV